jgi:hypothetical protein
MHPTEPTAPVLLHEIDNFDDADDPASRQHLRITVSQLTQDSELS